MPLRDTFVSMHLLSSHKATIINNDKNSTSNEVHYYYQQKYTTKEWSERDLMEIHICMYGMNKARTRRASAAFVPRVQEII